MIGLWKWAGGAIAGVAGALALLSQAPPAAPSAAPRPAPATRAALAEDGDAVRIASGYQQLKRDLAGHYWDPNTTANVANMPRIRPTQGDGGPRNGLLLDEWPVPTFWHMAQYSKLLAGEWRIERSAEAKRRIVANWAYIKKAYSPAQLAGDGGADHSVNISDDAAWKANYLADVHEITGDPQALAALMEMIPAVLARFDDPNQARIVYGASPAGRPFHSNPHGMLYAAAGDRQGTRLYGTISSVFEAMFAHAALYAYERSGDLAYRRYAENTYRWIHADLRNTKENPADAATGIYLCDLLLDPATFVNGRPVAKNRYFGKPIRGISAEYGGGTLAVAVLAARLYRLGGDPAYLAEARSIAAAFVRPDGFLRVRDGRPMIVTARDPWTEGYWYPDFVARVLPLPGVDPNGGFRAALRNTALAILRQRTADGYYGGDWSGPELNIVNGRLTWAEEARLANGGRGGGQGTPQQVMTSTSSGLVVQAAFALAR